VKDLHGHRIRGTPQCTQSAADALLVVFEHRGKGTAKSDAFVLNDSFFNLRIKIQLLDRDKLQTVFGADIDAPIAQHALLSVVNGLNVAIETALGLFSGLFFGETRFDF
jgi:hypothetical protein